jgi:putative transposase
MKKLREEGFIIGLYCTKTVMRKLDLRVSQRIADKVTKKREHGDRVVDNLLNQNFNPVGPNQVWAGDIAYRRTG